MKFAALALTIFATPITAQDLIVQFAGGAPKDSISFHTAGCNIANAVVLIDLDGSKGELVFEANPVEITHGYGALSPVRGGDKRLQVFVRSLMSGDTLDLTADLDDMLGGSADITVGNAELAGATVQLALNDRVLSGIFDKDGTAKIALPTDASVCVAAVN